MPNTCEFDEYYKSYLCLFSKQDPKSPLCDFFEPSTELYGDLRYCRFVVIREEECKNVACQLAFHQEKEVSHEG